MSDWNALARLADQIGTLANPVTQIRGKSPEVKALDNGGAQAACVHDEEFEGVVTSDGRMHPLAQRVAEKDALDDRLARLQAFIAGDAFARMPAEQRDGLVHRLLVSITDVVGDVL